MTQVYGTSLLPGAQTFGSGGLGVLGAVIRASTGSGAHGPGYLYNDWDGVADDAKEFRGVIETAPALGTLLAAEDGSFTFSGAPDGAYSFSYRLYVDGVDLGLASVALTVGAVVVASLNDVGGIASAEMIGAPQVTASGGAQAGITGAGGIPSLEAFGMTAVTVTAPAAITAGRSRIGVSASGELVTLTMLAGGRVALSSNGSLVALMGSPISVGIDAAGKLLAIV
ncbi:hypothetical protein HNP55_003535 [Paucibacter oligotrophus]|uniref:Uncharacterized protein n=1 Tax=Roseateles oligotrophus TaxID=1769250 RepID=A0A840LG24_9BURK|nr:hypothetical protein [Roseateles oligotrophus]MBB4844989.1 hypothetical protein [Roseateles oligotrophus]